jgi:hypothetical protein
LPEKPLRFTRHARNRMRKEGVRSLVVETCVRGPEHVTASILGRKNLWRRHEEGYLRVTIAEEDETLVVVTVTVRRRMPEEMLR